MRITQQQHDAELAKREVVELLRDKCLSSAGISPTLGCHISTIRTYTLNLRKRGWLEEVLPEGGRELKFRTLLPYDFLVPECTVDANTR